MQELDIEVNKLIFLLVKQNVSICSETFAQMQVTSVTKHNTQFIIKEVFNRKSINRLEQKLVGNCTFRMERKKVLKCLGGKKHRNPGIERSVSFKI